MSRRADAPQTTNADTPRAAGLRRAALECVGARHGITGHPLDCPLKRNLPDTLDPKETNETLHAVVHITGKGIDSINPAYLRSQLRRWAIKQGARS